ncbi:MAG TPA: hypothetical protein VMM76_04875 [Pirellulaceae bacterium]|nr:hypothetical protein [Pirellulaceae bacterium]
METSLVLDFLYHIVLATARTQFQAHRKRQVPKCGPPLRHLFGEFADAHLRALLVCGWWNFIGTQHVFGTASNGQDMHLVTFDRKDCPVTGSRTETEGQITVLHARGG